MDKKDIEQKWCHCEEKWVRFDKRTLSKGGVRWRIRFHFSNGRWGLWLRGGHTSPPDFCGNVHRSKVVLTYLFFNEKMYIVPAWKRIELFVIPGAVWRVRVQQPEHNTGHCQRYHNTDPHFQSQHCHELEQRRFPHRFPDYWHHTKTNQYSLNLLSKTFCYSLAG